MPRAAIVLGDAPRIAESRPDALHAQGAGRPVGEGKAMLPEERNELRREDALGCGACDGREGRQRWRPIENRDRARWAATIGARAALVPRSMRRGMLVPHHGRVVVSTGREGNGRTLRRPRGVMNGTGVEHQGLSPQREKEGDGDQGVLESASYRAMHCIQSVTKSYAGKGFRHNQD